jgi:hypothetical protein
LPQLCTANHYCSGNLLIITCHVFSISLRCGVDLDEQSMKMNGLNENKIVEIGGVDSPISCGAGGVSNEGSDDSNDCSCQSTYYGPNGHDTCTICSGIIFITCY